MITVENIEVIKKEGRSVDVNAWIVKPFKPETLISTVREIIG